MKSQTQGGGRVHDKPPRPTPRGDEEVDDATLVDSFFSSIFPELSVTWNPPSWTEPVNVWPPQLERAPERGQGEPAVPSVTIGEGSKSASGAHQNPSSWIVPVNDRHALITTPPQIECVLERGQGEREASNLATGERIKSASGVHRSVYWDSPLVQVWEIPPVNLDRVEICAAIMQPPQTTQLAGAAQLREVTKERGQPTTRPSLSLLSCSR